MTICIAAMAHKNTKLVLVIDQMVTINVAMPYQYETDDVAKYHELRKNVVVLTAGNAQPAFEIVSATRRRMAATQPTSFEDIAELLRLEYQAHRRRIVIQSILEPRGLDLASYYQNQQTLHAGVVQDIDSSLRGWDLGVEMLVAGHDGEECHISSLHNPGLLVSHDAIGFACVGIGTPHATYHLIGADYKKSLPLEQAEALVKDAKKKSEMAPGVGSETAVFYLPRGEDDA